MPRKKLPKKRKSSHSTLPPEVRRGIIAVLLFTLAFFSTLSFVELGGEAGVVFNQITGVLFGLLRYLIPPLALLFAVTTLTEKRIAGKLLPITLLLLSLLALLQQGANDKLSIPSLMSGGGYLGFIISLTLTKITGHLASLVLLSSLFIVAFVWAFRVPLLKILRGIGRGLSFIFGGLRKLFVRRPKQPAQQQLVMQGTSSFIAKPLRRFKIFARKEKVPAAVNNKKEEQQLAAKKILAKPSEAVGLPEVSNAGASQASFPGASPSDTPYEIPLSLLEDSSETPVQGDVEGTKTRIQKTLEQFGIPVEMGDVDLGPTVTRYAFKPAEGIKLSRITALSNDLALALAAHPIRIEAPIPGKSLVGLEVPNTAVAKVSIKEVLSSPSWNERNSNLSIALGKDVAGHVVLPDIKKMPHLLLAGATGSGKTVALNSIIVSLLYQNSPSQCRLLLIDPKRVELPVYNGVPHLIAPVVTDVKKTISAFRFTIAEMDRRFEILQKAGCRDISSYNDGRKENLMPYLVVVVDELADLMAVAANEVEGAIIRLAQMARATGIHLIVATQRPSVDVITGLIKANITARVAFSVASAIDSRTIMDASGAEKLLGRGDMLFVSPEFSKPKRVQGAFLSEREIKALVSYIKINIPSTPLLFGEDKKDAPGAVPDFDKEPVDPEDEALYEEAKKTVQSLGKASATLLQRRLKIGYARAARILDILEERGIVGPGDGAKPREVMGVTPSPEAEQELFDESNSQASNPPEEL